MKYFLLLAFALLAACETTRSDKEPSHQKYTRITVTDVGGDLISEWIAEGRVKKSEQGYTIRAVERRSGPPNPQVNQYPNGRISTVTGQNIVLEETEKPEWLRKLDGE